MLNQTLAVAQARATNGAGLAVSFARSETEVLEAQRLRYRVFAEEMGARVPGAEWGIDGDLYDAHCQHLLVRDTGSGEVVGTYRLLPGLKARAIGSFYADGEFDLTRIQRLRDAMVEVGRSCVHPDYRTGRTIALLLAGLIAFAVRHDYRYLVGCASLSMADGGHAAASIYHRLERDHLSPAAYRVFPRCELPLETLRRDVDVQAPALIKGYLRIGAFVCSAPAWDPDFNTADILMLLPLSRMSARYARHFQRA